MRKKTFLFGVVLVLSMMTFMGCGNNTNNSATDSNQESPAATNTDLRDDDTNEDAVVSPGAEDNLGDDLEQGADDVIDGAEDAVDDAIDGTEDAVDDAEDALDGDDSK